MSHEVAHASACAHKLKHVLPALTRRQFIGSLAACGLAWPRHIAAAPFPVRLRKASPYEPLVPYILPGNDEFAGEKTAMEIVSALSQLIETRALPLAADFRGASPSPVRYRAVAADAFEAEFDQVARVTHCAERSQPGLQSRCEAARRLVEFRFKCIGSHRSVPHR